jgi:hypothetical protein
MTLSIVLYTIFIFANLFLLAFSMHLYLIFLLIVLFNYKIDFYFLSLYY